MTRLLQGSQGNRKEGQGPLRPGQGWRAGGKGGLKV